MNIESYVDDANFANSIDDRHFWICVYTGGQSNQLAFKVLSDGGIEYYGGGVYGGSKSYRGRVLATISVDNKACINFADHPGNHRNSITYIFCKGGSSKG